MCGQLFDLTSDWLRVWSEGPSVYLQPRCKQTPRCSQDNQKNPFCEMSPCSRALWAESTFPRVLQAYVSPDRCCTHSKFQLRRQKPQCGPAAAALLPARGTQAGRPSLCSVAQASLQSSRGRWGQDVLPFPLVAREASQDLLTWCLTLKRIGKEPRKNRSCKNFEQTSSAPLCLSSKDT